MSKYSYLSILLAVTSLSLSADSIDCWDKYFNDTPKKNESSKKKDSLKRGEAHRKATPSQNSATTPVLQETNKAVPSQDNDAAPILVAPQKAEPISEQNTIQPKQMVPVQQEVVIADDSSQTNPAPAMNQSQPMMDMSSSEGERGGFGITPFCELLIWDSGVDQVMDATVIESTVNGIPNTITSRTLYTSSIKYDLGVRAGLKYELPNIGWDMEGEYIYFQNNKSSSTSREGGSSTFDPIWVNSTTSSWPAQTVTNTWNLIYNQADLVFGKEIKFSDYYFARPTMGGRYINCSSNFQINADDNSGVEYLTYYNHVQMKNNLSVGGFVFGLDNKFMMGYGLSLMGSVNAGLAYGTNNILYTTDYLSQTETATLPINSYNTMTGRDLIPLIDVRIDLGWEYDFYDGAQTLSLMAGYDFKALVSAFTTMTFPTVDNFNPATAATELPTVDHTNLFLQGFNVGVMYRF